MQSRLNDTSLFLLENNPEKFSDFLAWPRRSNRPHARRRGYRARRGPRQRQVACGWSAR